jgi:hypothetical protein
VSTFTLKVDIASSQQKPPAFTSLKQKIVRLKTERESQQKPSTFASLKQKQFIKKWKRIRPAEMNLA